MLLAAMRAAFETKDASKAVQLSVSLPSSIGTFTIALDGQHKPITVGNFLNYVTFGRYFATDPTTHMLASSFIHRSVPGFVVQGGGFIGTVDSAEPAVLVTLPMGNYTAIIRGVGAMPTGLALLEIYPQ